MPTTPFPYRLAASDLDGTLLGPHKDISAANHEAIGQLQAQGVKFVLASGRRHQNSVRFYHQLKLDTLLISCAGALIKDPASDETIHEVLLPPALADALVADGLASGYTVIYYHRNHLYIGGSEQWVELYEGRVGEKAEHYPNLRDLRGDAALKVVWYGEPAEMQRRRGELAHEHRDDLTVLATDPENLEFSDPQANKAEALAIVAARYRVEPAAVISFGDGENDAPMLRWAGLGVAVDGAKDTAKAAANMIAPPGPPENSFARAVAQIIDGTWQQHVRSRDT